MEMNRPWSPPPGPHILSGETRPSQPSVTVCFRRDGVVCARPPGRRAWKEAQESLERAP